jgi:hypothetical protein
MSLNAAQKDFSCPQLGLCRIESKIAGFCMASAGFVSA